MINYNTDSDVIPWFAGAGNWHCCQTRSTNIFSFGKISSAPVNTTSGEKIDGNIISFTEYVSKQASKSGYHS